MNVDTQFAQASSAPGEALDQQAVQFGCDQTAVGDGGPRFKNGVRPLKEHDKQLVVRDPLRLGHP